MAFLRLVACSSVLASVDAARVAVAKTNATAGVEGGSDAEASNSYWEQYVAAVTRKADASGRGYQDACKPQMHRNQGRYRGSIMLFHGFTACPQQFEKLIPALTSRGYTVFNPVLPGHGYNFEPRGNSFNDFVADLPSHNAEEEYRVFAREMHQVMQAAQGEKVIFGMSLGGGVAAWLGHLGGYDRSMLAAPLILAGRFFNPFLSVISLSPGRRYRPLSWGQGCEDERAAGRAGICAFNPAILKAARDLGRDHSNDATRDGLKVGDMQIVFVEEDSAVSTNAVINLAIKYGFDKSTSKVCGMDEGMGHSFLSPYDDIHVDKYWIPEVTQKIADYLTQGQPLAQDGLSTSGWPGCEITSSPR